MRSGIASAPQSMHVEFMNWSPMLTDYDNEVATGLHSNKSQLQIVLVRSFLESDTGYG